jgi:hypothetical protein
MSKKSSLGVTLSVEPVCKSTPVGSKVLNYAADLRDLSDQLLSKVNEKLSCISADASPAPAANVEACSNNYPTYFLELNYILERIEANLNEILASIHRVEL